MPMVMADKLPDRMTQHAEIGRALPFAVAHVPIESADAVRKIEQHRKNMFDHRLRAVSANVANGNAMLSGGRKVDVVGAGGRQSDELQGWRFIDQLAVDPYLVGEYIDGVADALAALVRRSGIEEFDSGQCIRKRRTVDPFGSHGRKIEKHGFHLS